MPIEVDVRFWAGARRAAGHESERIAAATVGELREVLAARPELHAVCAVASFLVDGRQASDGTALTDGASVDVLPPFAGGSGAGGSGADDVVGLHVWVSGAVQGVGFRAWTAQRARRLGLTGWVANLPDSRVELVASGPRSTCDRLLDALTGAEAPGTVEDVRAQWDEPSPGSRFEVR